MAELLEQAGILDITVNGSTDYPLDITWDDALGTPIDITGYSAEMQIRSQDNGCGDLLATFSTENGDIVITGPTGNIVVNISADKNTFGNSTNYYDLRVFEPGQKHFILLRGKFKSIASVSQVSGANS